MKRRDPIVEELHKLRERIGRAHDFDADRIAAAIRQHEREGGSVLLRATPQRARRQADGRGPKAASHRLHTTGAGARVRAGG
jgi:hypothetical protein